MPGTKTIGGRLKKLRGKTPIEKVCSDNDISYSAMTKYEAGLRMPRDEVKKKLADYYGSDVNSIFFAD